MLSTISFGIIFKTEKKLLHFLKFCKKFNINELITQNCIIGIVNEFYSHRELVNYYNKYQVGIFNSTFENSIIIINYIELNYKDDCIINFYVSKIKLIKNEYNLIFDNYIGLVNYELLTNFIIFLMKNNIKIPNIIQLQVFYKLLNIYNNEIPFDKKYLQLLCD